MVGFAGNDEFMLKLIRSAVATAVASWAWHNRSQVISTVKSLVSDTKKSKKSTDDPSRTGYAKSIDNDGLMTPEQAKSAADA